MPIPPVKIEKIHYLTQRLVLVPYMTEKYSLSLYDAGFIFGAQFDTPFTSVGACYEQE